MQSTPEQIDAIALSANLDSKGMKLIAFAGAGKTTTLKMIAEKHKELGNKGLYLAFNKDIAKEAGGKMPSNIQSSTFHSLAYRASPRWMIDKINEPGLTGQAFAETFNLQTLWVTGYVKKKGSTTKTKGKIPLSPYHQKKIVDEGLNEFMRTNASQPASRHLKQAMDKIFEDVEDRDKKKVVEALLPIMLTIWGDYINPEGVLGLNYNHDVYLKLWALTNPILDVDFILFDEAQDANPIIIGVLLQQKCPVIYVGDPHQQIYAWRGAINVMQKLDVPARYLTQSFRFGDNLAKFCQPILDYLGERNTFKGLRGNHTTINTSISEPTDIDVALCRTNIGAVELMIKFGAEGVDVMPANININETMSMLKAIHQFRNDPESQAKHPILKNFADFDELVQYNEEYFGDQSIAPFLKLYQQYKYGDIQRILAERNKVGDSYDFQVTTAHKAKGMEWDNVYIHDDFHDHFFNKDGTPKDAGDEEYRLLYVAMTRAKKKLYAANAMRVLNLIK